MAVGAKQRFEVFKRDGFKCQYCGRAAPEVLLHVDHIKPVVEGGGDDILNLITACADCNLGKGPRPLSDGTAVEKQRQQLEDLEARREQLALMMEWRDELAKLGDQALGYFTDRFRKLTDYGLSEKGRKDIKKVLADYPLSDVIDALERAANEHLIRGHDGKVAKESAQKVFDFVPKICYWREQEKARPYMKDLFYIRGIVRNRIRLRDSEHSEALSILEAAYIAGVPVHELRGFAVTADYWDDLKDRINKAIEQHRRSGEEPRSFHFQEY